jgi:hypothetical protein
MAATTIVHPVTHSEARERGAQAVLLSLLYSLPAIWVLRSLSAVTDPDIWWHLAAGKWILQHKAIPRTDPFSAYAMGKSWEAYSWAFEAPAAWLVTHLGLVGLLLLHCVLVTAVIIALHRLIASSVGDFTISVLLTFAAAYAMSNLFTPRPWLVTILFFILELHIILQVRESRNYRQLAWLPLIFCAWANLHVQFVYGLFLLMLVAVDGWWRWWSTRCDLLQRRARNLWTLTVIGCFAATLLNPYFARIYRVAYQLGTMPKVLNLISELGPIPFRFLPDYLLLLVGLFAIAALVWRREVRPFPWAVLLWAIIFSFRSRRDLWLLAIVGMVTIAASLRGEASVSKLRHSILQLCAVTIGTVLLIGACYRVFGLSSDKLQQQIAAVFPTGAVDFVKEKRLVGPLFNDYGWGGYLIWSLPEMPVSIDGRAGLYGTPRLERSFATWDAHHDWNADPELRNARLIIGGVDAALCAVLRLDPRYELVYEDNIASVFIRRGSR